MVKLLLSHPDLVISFKVVGAKRNTPIGKLIMSDARYVDDSV
jgi:hypothetical protein